MPEKTFDDLMAMPGLNDAGRAALQAGYDAATELLEQYRDTLIEKWPTSKEVMQIMSDARWEAATRAGQLGLEAGGIGNMMFRAAFNLRATELGRR